MRLGFITQSYHKRSFLGMVFVIGYLPRPQYQNGRFLQPFLVRIVLFFGRVVSAPLGSQQLRLLARALRQPSLLQDIAVADVIESFPSSITWPCDGLLVDWRGRGSASGGGGDMCV